MCGSNSRPTFCDTRAASGTADTPALPISGFMRFSFLQKRFIILAMPTPPIVAIMNDRSPRRKIMIESLVRNTSACVEHPTVTPIRMVTTSMSGPRAVSASLLVTPLSFRRLPKKSMPRSGMPDGTMSAVRMNPTIGKIIFSLWLTSRGFFMRMSLSFLVVISSMIGRWITGTSAMYEYADTAMAPIM